MLELGVAGVGDAPILASGVVATGPGGGGWEVAGLADPGRTAGLESPMLGFVVSAYPLCEFPVDISTFLSLNGEIIEVFWSSYQGCRDDPTCLYRMPLTPGIRCTGLVCQCSRRAERGAQHDGLRGATKESWVVVDGEL